MLLNVANENGSQGISVADEAIGDPGHLIDRNTTSHNLSDGIVVLKGGHTIVANTARDNGGWGINAAAGNVDGSLNAASGNGQAAQCSGVVCKPEWDPPETTILSAPPAPSTSGFATFTFAASEPASFARSLDVAASAGCRSPHTYDLLPLGTHEFRVRATDALGNTDPTPASWSFTRVGGGGGGGGCGMSGEAPIALLAWAGARRLRRRRL